jgi:hypothetical protein
MEDIFVSSAVWYEIDDKIDFEPIQELLNDFELSTYSEEVTGINFFYLCWDEEESEDFQDELFYDEEEHHINIYRILPYESVLEATEEEMQELMKQSFLSSIELFTELEIAFDVERFKEDVEGRFYPEEVEVE